MAWAVFLDSCYFIIIAAAKFGLDDGKPGLILCSKALK